MGSGQYTGRWMAVAIAIGSVLTMSGLCCWSGGSGDFLKAVTGAWIAAVVFVPIAWLIGRKYDLLKAASERDYLTDLRNRRFIELSFPKLAAGALRDRRRLSVLLLDVNDFKKMNDSFGHDHGDKALKIIAGALEACAEQEEIIGRWGGDEFIVICPYSEDRMIENFNRLLHEQLRRLSLAHGLQLSLSAGHVHFPDQGEELDVLVKIADKRMYADKHSRKATAFDTEALQA